MISSTMRPYRGQAVGVEATGRGVDAVALLEVDHDLHESPAVDRAQGHQAFVGPDAVDRTVGLLDGAGKALQVGQQLLAGLMSGASRQDTHQVQRRALDA